MSFSSLVYPVRLLHVRARMIGQTGVAAAGGERGRGQRLLPLHAETRGAAVRRDADGPDPAQLVLRALRGHVGAQQLPARRDAGGACRLRGGETSRTTLAL